MSKFLCGAIALCLFAGVATAVPMTFFGEDSAGASPPTPLSDAAQASFLSFLTGVTIESFEGKSVGDTLPFSVSFGAVTASLTGTGEIRGSEAAGRFATDGSKYLESRPGYKLTFDAPQVAFGFYGTDVGDFDGLMSVSFGGAPAIAIPHATGSSGATPPNGNAFFFGYIDVDAPFTTVDFFNTDTSDAFGFDEFTIGDRDQVIPEPGTMALLGIGLLGVGGAVYRRRRARKTDSK
jgi:hypothetical protein